MEMQRRKTTAKRTTKKMAKKAVSATAVFPMRINRYLAQKNIATRKEADELIEKGRVLVNGKRAVLGQKIAETDAVEVRAKQKTYVYLAYYKPRGVITHANSVGENDIRKNIARDDVFPVGRLDKDSSGLIILTNDGRITDKLLNPTRVHEKEYVVTTVEKLRTTFKDNMEKGMRIENEITRPCKVEVLDDHTFRIVLTEGKKHQIRRMVSALFNEVKTLKRVRVMNIRLGTLAPNTYRPIEGKELELFLESLF